ncbi:basic leucine zipper transcriptional factor ATF-like 2 isoform X1 [Pteronotus mesoamericanus]|uniref:basic leucine zipper transcriptional factor ATF-like 2 isoform X1 n=1 Tax=Pteronotus mesoamericanus TaxID=1884717 RepID=UPI0023ED4609|nr:basic leucine zipper transcriptional factor ATF-like 2 isoform X1 [Pteronotus parnellii mesoamericanus]
MHLCGGEGLLTGQDPEEHQKQLKKKQKNRVSAQRSRQKHTDKADTLHQHESLERHNHALRKEIQGLQLELAWWRRTWHMHERLCPTEHASCLAPLPPEFWGQPKRPLDPTPQRPHGCQQQADPFQSPVSSPAAQHKLSPYPQPHGSPGLLLSPLPLLSPCPTAVTVPPAQPSPSPVQPASPSGSSLLRPSSKLKDLLPHSSAQAAPPQPFGPEHLTQEKLVSSPHSPSTALGLACLQDMDKPAFSSADQQGLGVDLSPHPLPAFPLLSSARVHF